MFVRLTFDALALFPVFILDVLCYKYRRCGLVVSDIIANAVNFTRQASRHYIKHSRFWAMDGNRKWGVISFNLPWRYHICLTKFLYSYRDDIRENSCRTTAHESETSVAQKNEGA